MRPFLGRLGLGLGLGFLAACSSPSAQPSATTAPAHEQGSMAAAPPVDAAADPTTAPRADGVAYFAGGCFWGVEHYMEQLPGVLSVESGYMGGHVDAPSYEQVSSQTSGHLETVEVRFDPARISYEAVAKRFFEIHDPTQADGQGPDIGPEYRSAVFFTSPEQKQTTEALIDTLKARGYAVVTEVRPAARFWRAEDYHQDYYANTGKTPYCHSRVRRFGD
jgi:peptide methionine sulfoxide reductase msrA/msrB